MATASFRAINRDKADFTNIYIQPDPRAYFQMLGALDYVIPHLAQPIFAQLIEERRRTARGPITVLDLGCSYGINGMLLKYDVSYDAVRERYETPAVQRLAPEVLLSLDRHFLASWPSRPHIRVIGLDASWRAVEYAKNCGAIDAGIVADLEAEEIPVEARAELAEVDVIISTGCVGYIASTTFEKLAACRAKGAPPWVASFVLRMFDYREIANALSRQGLITERFEGATFIQRRFRDEDEMGSTLRILEERGLDPAGKEGDGLFHAELFVSRPPKEVARHPINRLVSIASGTNRRYGRRPEPAWRTALHRRPPFDGADSADARA